MLVLLACICSAAPCIQHSIILGSSGATGINIWFRQMLCLFTPSAGTLSHQDAYQNSASLAACFAVRHIAWCSHLQPLQELAGTIPAFLGQQVISPGFAALLALRITLPKPLQ